MKPVSDTGGEWTIDCSLTESRARLAFGRIPLASAHFCKLPSQIKNTFDVVILAVIQRDAKHAGSHCNELM